MCSPSRAERNAARRILLPIGLRVEIGSYEPIGGDVPQFHRAVEHAHHEQLAIGAEIHFVGHFQCAWFAAAHALPAIRAPQRKSVGGHRSQQRTCLWIDNRAEGQPNGGTI